MQVLNSKLKYPLSLFVLVIVLKIIYIYVESQYNFDVLNITTSANLKREVIESLNGRGHLIASTGFTLFVFPLIYYFSRGGSFVWLKLVFSSIVIFFIFYFSLNMFVDYIVKANQDKRYEAYYTNMVKYGMLNRVLYYQSYIDKDNLDNLSIDDRILLVNIFLLLYSDKELIDKFKQKGEHKAFELYLNKNKKDEFEKEYKKFRKLALEVEKFWKEFNSAKIKLLSSISKINSEDKIKQSYQKMIDKLDQKYNLYRNSVDTIQEKIAENTTLKKLRDIRLKLEKYYKYQNYKRAKQQYKEEMIKSFGYYINPNDWLDESGNLTYQSITKVIRREIINKVKKRVDNLPLNLTKKEFINNIQVKREVAKYLKKYDILIAKDFDYSYKEFKKSYLVMTHNKTKEAQDRFYEKIKDKIGKNDLTLNTTYEDFIRSQTFVDILKKHKVKNIRVYQQIFLSKNIANFKVKVLIPKFYELAKKRLFFEKAEFYKDNKVAKYGDEAIKLLYIPPIALSLSIIAMLLNIVSLIVMIVSLLNIHTIYRYFIRVILIGIIVIMPLAKNSNSLQNNIIWSNSSSFVKYFLIISGYWIKVNYKIKNGN